MSFNTVSPVRFGMQTQVKRTASPLQTAGTNIHKATAIQDSVHFRGGTHTYEIPANSLVKITTNSQGTTTYVVGSKFASQDGEDIYSLGRRGKDVGTITGKKDSSYSEYSLDNSKGDAETHKLTAG